MKLSKVLSLVIAFAMLLTASTLGTAYAFSDVATDSDAYEAVTALSALNIIKGYEDGTFLPDGKITRAEFATIVMRTLGMNVDSKVDTIFDDVKADHWASGAINEAFGAGIVNGRSLTYAADNETIIGGTFDPEAEVTYDEAVKMIVCAMGYNLKAESLVKPGVNPFPTAYNLIANQKGITDGVAKVAGGASRATVAKLIWNALPVELMDQTTYGSEAKFEELSYQSLLYTKLKAVLLDAKIESISLDKDEKNVDLTNIELDDVANDAKNYDGDTSDFTSIDKGACNLAGLQGLKVKVLVDISDSKNPVAIAIFPASTNKYLTVDPDLFVKINGSASVKNPSIEYYKTVEAGSTNTSSKIEYPFSVYSNLMLIGTYGTSSSIDWTGLETALNKCAPTGVSRKLEPNNVAYQFVDTNNNGYYDTMFIENKASFVVGKVNADDNSFNASSSSSVMNSKYTYEAAGTEYDFNMDLDPEDDDIDWVMTDEAGKELTVADINVGDVVTIAMSVADGKTFYDIVVCKSSAVTGSVSEIKTKTKNNITNTYYVIDGKSYLLNNTNETIDAGATGTFNITADGKIISYDLDATTRNFAAILKVASDDDSFSNGAAVQLMTADGSISKVKFASDFYIYGVAGLSGTSSKDGNAAGFKFSKLTTADENAINNVVSGSVAMYELNKSGEVKKLYIKNAIKDKDEDYEFVTEDQKAYKESSEKLGKTYFTDSSVVVAIETFENNNAAADKLNNNKSEYSVISKGSLVDEETYTYAAVVNSDKEAVMIVMQGFEVLPAWDSAPLYVTGVSTVSVDGENRDKITGYVGREEVSYTIAEDPTFVNMEGKKDTAEIGGLNNKLVAGDAIQFTLNGDNEISAYRHLVKVQGDNAYYLVSDNVDSTDNDKTEINASLVKVAMNGTTAPKHDDNNFYALGSGSVVATGFKMEGYAIAGRVKEVKSKAVHIFVDGSDAFEENYKDVKFDDSLPLFAASEKYSDGYKITSVSSFKSYKDTVGDDIDSRLAKSDDFIYIYIYDGDVYFQYSVDLMNNNK